MFCLTVNNVVFLLELVLFYMHCCYVHDCCVVIVRHLSFFERVASSKHKLSLPLTADDNTMGLLFLIAAVGANAWLNKVSCLWGLF